MKSVVIAEDNDGARAMYAEAFQRKFPGVHVDAVATGRELVAYVLDRDPSLVASDNDMEEPGAGLEALRRIREVGNGVPFYLMSGRKEVKETALAAGATGFCYKDPAVPNFMRTMLEDAAQYLRDAE